MLKRVWDSWAQAPNLHLDVEINPNDAIVCGSVIKRPSHINVTEWMQIWSSIRDRNFANLCD
jgi:hypothetical protein